MSDGGLRRAYVTAALRGARWVALFAVALAFNAGNGFDLTDETWFLQVARRVASGDVLYRDVFFGATPLAVYLTAAAVRVFGAEILVVKAIAAAVFTATLAVSLALARRFGATRRAEVALGAAFFLFALPVAAPVYTPLATLFLLATLLAALGWIGQPTDGEWLERGEPVDRKPRREKGSPQGAESCGQSGSHGRRRLLVAGGLAGLCFGAKWNLGFFALAALVGAIAVTARARGLGRGGVARSVALASSAFAATAVASLLPVLLSGGFERFLEYGFFGKTVYLDLGSTSYLEEVWGLGRLALAPTFSPEILAVWTSFLVPPIAFLGIAAFSVHARRDPRAVALGLFAGAAALGLFPNPNLRHVADSCPGLIVGLAAAWVHFRGRVHPGAARLARVAAAAWLGLGLAAVAAQPVVDLARGRIRPCAIPHFRGTLASVDKVEWASRAVEALRPIAGERPFLLSPYAGFFYLALESRNPTPFDYPLSTPFGRRGQQDTIAAIERGEIRCVVWHPNPAQRLRPEALERYLGERMDSTERRGPWTVYRRRVGAR